MEKPEIRDEKKNICVIYIYICIKSEFDKRGEGKLEGDFEEAPGVSRRLRPVQGKAGFDTFKIREDLQDPHMYLQVRQ